MKGALVINLCLKKVHASTQSGLNCEEKTLTKFLNGGILM